jgi:hypothetical protein
VTDPPSPPSSALAPKHPGLLEKLMAAVRPEFRGEVLVFDPRDPVFGGPACRVSGCIRTGRSRGLCSAHYLRWRKQGQPELDRFAATTDPQCRSGFGKGSVLDPVPAFERRVSLADLGPQLRLEVQYALQRHLDQGRVKTAPHRAARMVRLLAGLQVVSLLDWSQERWRAAGSAGPPPTTPRHVPWSSTATSKSKTSPMAPGGRRSIPATSGGCATSACQQAAVPHPTFASTRSPSRG